VFTTWPTWIYVLLVIGVAIFIAGLIVRYFDARTQAAERERVLLEVEELEARQIPNWNDDWRVTLRITNQSATDEYSAYLLAPVGGVVDGNYGDLNLQWDTVNTPFTVLVTGKPERLHVARVSPNRSVRFLSSGHFAGMPREFQQTELKVMESPIRSWILFSTRTGCQQRRRLEIHLDHENRPTIHMGEPEPC